MKICTVHDYKKQQTSNKTPNEDQEKPSKLKTTYSCNIIIEGTLYRHFIDLFVKKVLTILKHFAYHFLLSGNCFAYATKIS